MYQGHQRRVVLLFAVADALLGVVSFELAYRTRDALPLREFALEPPVKALTLVAALVAILGAGRWLGVYARLYAASRRRAIADTVRQMALASGALLAILYLLHFEVPVSRLFLALFVGVLTLLQLLLRTSSERLRGLLLRVFGAVTACVVVGDGPRALALAAEIEASERHGLRLLAVVDCAGGFGAEAQLARRYRVQRLDALPELLRQQAVDEVVFVVSAAQLPRLEGVFLLCDELGVRTRVAADFFPHVHSRVGFDRLGGRPLLTFSVAPADELQLLAKRAFDIALAAVGLAAAALPMLAIGLLVRATSPGPAIFRQQRCGLNGRRFTCYKFRSMVADAEALRSQLEHLNERDGPVFKMRADPRVTPVGRILRRYSVDEWPQLWNVLRGEMSFVGPRPALPEEVDRYEAWQRRRLRMRPGLTCLWAIRGRDAVGFDAWIRMDLEYIDTWSLLLDLKILALTVPVVAAGRSAN